VLDVFFICDTIEGDMPDRNVEALAVGSVSSSVTAKCNHPPEKGLRQWYDLYVSRGEYNPCLVYMPEGECFRGVVVPERGL
jgi:hypothetical protein